ILPVDRGVIVVPYYSPTVVFAAPPRGFVVASAIRFGYGVRIGVGFAPWGWGSTRFEWGTRRLIVNSAPWGRTWANRTVYVHPYTGVAVPRVVERRVPEQHEVHARSEHEREAERNGRGHEEEHKRKEDRRP